MADSNKNRKIKLQLSTETAVSIGGDQGNALSPYTDYVFSDDGGFLFYLDPEVIQQAMVKNGQVDEQLMDEYVAGIRDSMDNNRSNFDLKNFVVKTLGLPLNGSAVVRRRVPVEGLDSHRKDQISPVAKSAGRPYLPGSSIKGAIRTAVLYDWLVKSQQGKNPLKDLQADLDRVAKIKKENPNPRRMPFGARKDLRRLERNFFPEHKLFGSVRSPKGPDARRIRVSDSNLIEDGGLEVHHLKRIRLTPAPQQRGRYGGGGKSEIPIVREAIPAGLSFECSLSILPGFESPVLRYWEQKTPAEIFGMLNGFTLAALENEIYELNHAEGGQFQEEVSNLLNFYHKLRNRAENGEVFLRLGFGKTIYDNSLALAIYYGIDDDDRAADAFETYRRSFWRMNRHARTYPATRTVTQDGRPMGWVKVVAEQL